MQEPKNQATNHGGNDTDTVLLPPAALSPSVESGAVPADGEEKGRQISLFLQGISPAGAGKSWVQQGESALPLI